METIQAVYVCFKPWSNGLASRPRFSTCDYLRVRLTRALEQGRQIKNLQPKRRKNVNIVIFTAKLQEKSL